MKKIVNREYLVKSNKLPAGFDGFKIVMLSDLHDNFYGIDLDRLKSMISDGKPDIAILAGDMVLRKTFGNSGEVMELIKNVSRICPVYFSNGNHESVLNGRKDGFGKKYDDFMDELIKYACVLNDDSIEINRGGDSIHVYGFELPIRHYSRLRLVPFDEGFLDGRLGRCGDGFNILIAHNPDYFKYYAEWGADLVFSGHIHGGIVRMPWGKGLVSPSYRVFPRYDGGRYEIGDAVMILGRGLGAHTPNIRINNPPELVWTTLFRG